MLFKQNRRKCGGFEGHNIPVKTSQVKPIFAKD